MRWLLLAWRNVLRDYRRSLPVCFSVVVGVFSAHLVAGYMLATFEGLRFSTIQGGIGHIQIAAEGQFSSLSEHPLQHGLSKAQQEEILGVVRSHPDVKTAARRAVVQGLISNGERTMAFAGYGLEPALETRLFRSLNPVIKGSSLSATTDLPYRAVLGKDLGRFLETPPGSYVTLLSAMESGAINAIDVDVTGWMSTGVPEQDAMQINLPLDNVQSLLNTEKISRIIVMLNDTSRTEAVARDLARDLPEGIAVRSWEQLSPFYGQLKALYWTQFSVLGAILFVVAFLSILGATLTSVLERSYDIGVLQAIGIPRSRIRSGFAIEGCILGLFGAAVGLALSFAVTEVLGRAHIMLPPPPGRNIEVPLLVLWDPLAAAACVAGVLLLSVAAAHTATRRVIRLNVIDAIKRR